MPVSSNGHSLFYFAMKANMDMPLKTLTLLLPPDFLPLPLLSFCKNDVAKSTLWLHLTPNPVEKVHVKIKITGEVEAHIACIACAEPPEGRAH